MIVDENRLNELITDLLNGRFCYFSESTAICQPRAQQILRSQVFSSTASLEVLGINGTLFGQ